VASGEGRETKSGGFQVLALLTLGIFLLALFVGLAITEGIGDPSIPSGDVAVVEEAGDSGKIGQKDFDHAFQLVASQEGLGEVPKPGDPQYDELRELALTSVLEPVWIKAQAQEMGIAASDAEIAEELEKAVKERFGTRAKFNDYIKASGLTQEDIDRQVEVRVLSQEIQNRLIEEAPTPGEQEVEDYYEAERKTQFRTLDLKEVEEQIKSQLAQEKALPAFAAEYFAKWTSRTFCAEDYVSGGCANFKGDGHPATAPPACYESDPKNGLPEDCPAPVFQLIPASPGSVTPGSPRGNLLPQRPIPASESK
jgi:SurA-like protein